MAVWCVARPDRDTSLSSAQKHCKPGPLSTKQAMQPVRFGATHELKMSSRMMSRPRLKNWPQPCSVHARMPRHCVTAPAAA